MRGSGTVYILLPILLIGAVFLAPQRETAAERPVQDETTGLPAPVLHLRLDDEAITPVTARVIGRALEEAEAAGAQALVLELDTPGGLMESTQDIVKDILASPVPVVVYVSPPGARAASAGVFITVAAHVAAMAPATHIGAAHPVSIGGPTTAPADTGSGGGVMEKKIVNDAVAWVRSLADLRGRNSDWVAEAVSESASITAAEAAELGVVDFVAENLPALLEAVDGRSVTLRSGTVALATRDAEVRPVDVRLGDRILGVLSNPNLAFLLLMFGFYGILFELYTPGWGVGGTLGAVCIVLGFFAMAVLPINYAGLLLIALALGLFVAEVFFTSFGMLTVGGAVCLILGGLMLVDTPVPVLRVSAKVVVPTAIATAAIAFFLLGEVVRAHRTPVQMDPDRLVGTRVRADRAFTPAGSRYEGTLETRGEIWSARSEEPVDAGDEVEIVRREGLLLHVRRTAAA